MNGCDWVLSISWEMISTSITSKYPHTTPFQKPMRFFSRTKGFSEEGWLQACGKSSCEVKIQVWMLEVWKCIGCTEVMSIQSQILQSKEEKDIYKFSTLHIQQYCFQAFTQTIPSRFGLRSFFSAPHRLLFEHSVFIYKKLCLHQKVSQGFLLEDIMGDENDEEYVTQPWRGQPAEILNRDRKLWFQNYEKQNPHWFEKEL